MSYENSFIDPRREEMGKKDQAQRILNKIRSLYKKGDSDTMMETHGMIVEFTKKLHEKYGKRECEKYALYHALIGSSPLGGSWSDFPNVDFPDEDSVENFVEGLEK